jgi:NADPH:quinone reductase-like Zn-dependent oxidoreductase
VVRDADMVLDTVGGETLARSLDALKPGGILVSIVDEPPQEQAEARGVRAVFFVMEPRRQELVEIGQMIDAGQLRPLVAAVLSARSSTRGLRACAGGPYARQGRSASGGLSAALVRLHWHLSGRNSML